MSTPNPDAERVRALIDSLREQHQREAEAVNAEHRRMMAAEGAAQEARLAALSPEERAAWERAQEAEAERLRRKAADLAAARRAR